MFINTRMISKRTSIHSRAKFQLKRGISHPGYWRSNAGTCDRVFLFQLIIECIIPMNKGFHSLGLTLENKICEHLIIS